MNYAERDSIHHAPYNVLLDLQRALDPVIAKHEEMPDVVTTLMRLVDYELAVRNEIRKKIQFIPDSD